LFYVASEPGQAQILLGRRRFRPAPAQWAIFGGRRETGDKTMAVCAAREAGEETGATRELLGLPKPLADICEHSELRGFWIPGIYQWRTFLVRLPAIPSLAHWPLERNWSDEFIEVGWFGVNNLPAPTNWLTKLDIWRFRRELRRRSPI